MRKILFLLILTTVTISCSELQQIASQLPNTTVSNLDIANGLRAALDKGIDTEVSNLMQENGFYSNDAVKILLPEELRKVDEKMRAIGLGSLVDEGLKLLNRAAEDAVSEAKPIFVDAVKDITFTDARNILLGQENAATQYLQSKTSTALYAKFNPVINQSLSKVGADKVWSDIISRYNAIPLLADVNPDLTDYVTQEALNGVYYMIAQEEKDIRTDLGARTSDLLRRVFALQDGRRE